MSDLKELISQSPLGPWNIDLNLKLEETENLTDRMVQLSMDYGLAVLLLNDMGGSGHPIVRFASRDKAALEKLIDEVFPDGDE